MLAYVSFHYVSYKKFVLGQIEIVLANVMDEIEHCVLDGLYYSMV